MTMMGGNPAQMRILADQMEQESAELRGTFRALSGKLAGTDWQGPDAEGFRTRWEAHHRARLDAAIRELQQAAATLRHEASTQERISRS